MALITKTYTFSAGAVIIASEHNSNFDTIYNDYNGNITNANLSASAAIADTKLANITATGKVNFSALTVTSQAQGDLMYYNGSAWTRLGAGTSGQLLKTNGASANPAWASGSAAPGLTFSTTNGAGSALTFVATDATIAVFDATDPSTQAFGDSAVVGTAGTAARRDHKHAMPATPTGTIAAQNGQSGTANGATTTLASVSVAVVSGQKITIMGGVTKLGSGTGPMTNLRFYRDSTNISSVYDASVGTTVAIGLSGGFAETSGSTETRTYALKLDASSGTVDYIAAWIVAMVAI